MHYLANKAEAEDVTQEVFERMWRNIDKVSADEALPWLLSVAKNRCIDCLRQRKHHSDDLLDVQLCQRAQDTPEGFLATLNLSQWLKRAVYSLTEPYRSLVVYFDLQQLSVKEVAEKMSMSENQVKVYVFRARKKMRHYLQNTEL